jgi:hypothetical protein
LFDGIVGTYSAAPSANFVFGSAPFTIAVTVRNTSPLTGNGVIVGKGITGSYLPFLLLQQGNSFTFSASSSGSSWDVANSAVVGAVVPGTYQTIVIQRNSTYINGYVNGVMGSGFPISTSSTLYANSNNFTIGASDSNGANPYSGVMNNIMVWKGAAVPISTFVQTFPVVSQLNTFGGLPSQIPLTYGNTPVHSYTSPSAGFNVTETAWDQYGGYAQSSMLLPVYLGVPYASFTASPTSGTAGTLVTFTDTSYQGTASSLSYNWSFGDSAGTNPYSNVIGSVNHVFSYNGIFYTNLTITNANGTSYYVGPPITISNSGTQTYYLPVQVGLKLTDYYGAPLTGVSVVATPINFSAPAGWINTILGINANVNIINTSVGLNTDSLGVCTMPMIQSIEYTITVKGTSTLNPTETVNTSFTLYPAQTAYEFPLPTTLLPYALPTTQAATNQIIYSITNTSGLSTQTYTTTYSDSSGGTTYLQLFVENTTGAWIASANYTGSSANSETFSQAEPNPNGGTYTWGFIATQNQLGNITQTKVLNFPMFVNLMDATTGWAT